MSLRRQIEEQPRRLRALLDALAAPDHPLRSAACRRLLECSRVLFTGMGSSLYACYPARLRLAAPCWETSELIHFGGDAIGENTLVVAVSQSGETAEILALLDRLPERQPVVAVTNVPQSTLGRRAKLTLPLGAEPGAYATSQTYVNSVALLLALAYAARAEPLEPLLDAARAAADALEALLVPSFERVDLTVDRSAHLVFLARGPSLASARQAALMFHEVAVRGAAAMSAAAFRHGPLEMAGPGLHAVVFEPHGPTARLVEDLAVELEQFGARVTRIADERWDRGEFRHRPVEEELAPLVNIAPVQAMAYRAALALGRDPGVFRQTQTVTRRE